MTRDRTRIALVFGGQSPEHEVSIVSARFVHQVLLSLGYEVTPVGIDTAGSWHGGDDAFDRLCSEIGRADSGTAGLRNTDELTKLAGGAYDLVFPMIHGITGEDGCLQGLCEMLNLPYVGGGVLNQSLCMDKLTTRILLQRAGLPQPRFIQVLAEDYDPEEVAREVQSDLGYPVFVKPSRTGSSIGVAKVHREEELLEALSRAMVFDRRLIVECHVPGREIEVAAIGGGEPRLSEPGEIIPENEFYDFEEKYINNKTTFKVPATLGDAQKAALMTNAAKAWKGLNCYGLARIDFLVTEEEAIVNEINTIPGFTQISMYPRLLETIGVSVEDALDRLIALAFERHRSGGRKQIYLSKSNWFRG